MAQKQPVNQAAAVDSSDTDKFFVGMLESIHCKRILMVQTDTQSKQRMDRPIGTSRDIEETSSFANQGSSEAAPHHPKASYQSRRRPIAFIEVVSDQALPQADMVLTTVDGTSEWQRQDCCRIALASP